MPVLFALNLPHADLRGLTGILLGRLIVHNVGGILAIPSLHTVTKHQGMNVPTLEKQDEKSCLVVMPLAWVHSRVATCWNPAAPRALLPWLCWGLPVLDPHGLVRLHIYPITPLHLPLLYLHVDGSGWDSLHMQRFPACSLPWVRASKLCHSSPTSALGGDDGPVSRVLWRCWERGVARQVARGADKTNWTEEHLQNFLTGLNTAVLTIQ